MVELISVVVVSVLDMKVVAVVLLGCLSLVELSRCQSRGRWVKGGRGRLIRLVYPCPEFGHLAVLV